ncbi:hypothetical protein I7I50_02893 [Histoplasma capsulatum G186AR]|uniref:Uncharacterized protein n=1 Tax=Ajellomyces capsulatus TaxID=5037 RepID=A0A8H8D5R7_AJECA|nr:hypothetical protein I7I52_00441 [Histoplasma capsulatum]QSS71883.1 hypothetical protein I7I50_02893 [Histoplasma capsulatum G186AR]
MGPLAISSVCRNGVDRQGTHIYSIKLYPYNYSTWILHCWLLIVSKIHCTSPTMVSGSVR